MPTTSPPVDGSVERASRAVEIAVHALLALLTIGVVILHAASYLPGTIGLTLLAAAGLHAGSLVALRRPVPGYAITAMAMLVLVLSADQSWASWALPSAAFFLRALWLVTTRSARARQAAALTLALVGVLLSEVVALGRDGRLDEIPAGLSAGLLPAGIVGAVWAGAVLTRARRTRARAAQSERLAAARAAERAEIRGDLHDGIAHSMTVIVAKAEAAAITAPDTATATELVEIAESGREALVGLRAMLTVLDSPVAGRALPLSIDAIAELVAAAATPVHRVRFAEDGGREPLDPAAEAALVRVAQEAVTNALRHLRPPVTVRVGLTWRDGATLVVRDDGGAGLRAAGPPGSGLRGVAARVAAAGGTLRVDPGPGWTVRAWVPTRGSR